MGYGLPKNEKPWYNNMGAIFGYILRAQYLMAFTCIFNFIPEMAEKCRLFEKGSLFLRWFDFYLICFAVFKIARV
jgi:hypothetical protein